MIISMTVHDNDFSNIIANFLQKLPVNILDCKEDEDINDWYSRHKRLNNILNPNIDNDLTDDNLEYLKQEVKNSFAYYVRNHKSKDYLLEKLEIDIISSLQDEWENGENCYWFQHSGCVVCQ